MDEREIIKIVEEQERALRFKDLDLKKLKKISLSISESLEEKEKPCYIETYVNGLVVFALCLNGANKNNEEWARRKRNLANRYATSSLRASINMRLGGKTYESTGMDPKDFGLSGGAFPILLSSGLCIGSITVSGMSEIEDHQAVVDELSKELNAPVPSLL